MSSSTGQTATIGIVFVVAELKIEINIEAFCLCPKINNGSPPNTGTVVRLPFKKIGRASWVYKKYVAQFI